ncbi:PREDICTED: extracellular calcium-sensing receptor-like [Nanorana parkeri]|uniref:extracellular calcium-sensing receptor-like n=1 Tax=Nanorana parkeri TaxID=125878 RepID=UPI0008545F60|nr:PREDICTED: extracellular calcium-sensing receptor-like [Nanorana parkeri]
MAALLCRVGVRASSCLLSSSSMLNYTEEGHILLGMIGPVNTASVQSIITFTAEPPPHTCDLFRRDQYKSILALLLATKEINQNLFLPNITLGFYMFDSCFSAATSLKATLQVVTGAKNPVSYAASLPNLSNKEEFPSFLRTVVNVDSQPQALIDLCRTLGWTWIGILISSTDYGTQGGIALKKVAANSELLHYMKRVDFVNTAGEEVSFDDKGNIHGYFDILNWNLMGNKGQYTKVGTYNEYITSGPKLFINTTAIQWPGGLGKVPSSVCSDDCPPGYRKAPRRGQPACCFDCVMCPEGMISNETNSVDCQPCPEDQWPNSRRTKCIPKVIEFLSYEEPLGLVMATCSVLFFIITVMVLCIFHNFRDTAMVKANNRNLSYLILLSLKFCFLCSLMFIGCPTKLTCTVRQSLFGITFSVCVSCILAKTIIVVIAFKATKPGSNLRLWVGFKTAGLVVTFSTAFQIVIILVWLAKFPPFLEHNHQVLVGTILLECNEGSVVMFYCTIGYLGVLAAVSFVVAFLARNLPDSFNEAKYITFSMLTFLSVWSTFIPAYLSTKGKYIVAVEIFSILLSSFGLLCCIFAPKCYIILLKPSMNTREFLMSKNK